MNKNSRLTGLEAKHFMHPGDRIGIEKIKQISMFKKLMEKLLVDGLEDDIYLYSLADKVRLGPKQGKKLNDMLLEASDILDIKKPPTLFMDTDPVPNAYSYGKEKSIIVLTSGLVDMFSDEELFAVIGHELGHIKCGHTLYTFMADNIGLLIHLLSMVPVMGAVGGVSLQFSLLVWYRRAELSADRAALIVTQSKDVIVNTMMKISGGGSSKICESLSEEAFLEQAAEYEILQRNRMKTGAYKKLAYIFGTLMATAESSHPWPTVRAMEAIKFYNSDRYKRILAKDYPAEEEIPEGIFAHDSMVNNAEIGKAMYEIAKGPNVFGGIKGLWGKTKESMKQKKEDRDEKKE